MYINATQTWCGLNGIHFNNMLKDLSRILFVLLTAVQLQQQNLDMKDPELSMGLSGKASRTSLT